MEKSFFVNRNCHQNSNMLLIVAPHRGSAYLFKSSDSDIWVRESTPSQELYCWAALPLHSEVIPRGTSWKEQKGNTAPLAICPPGCRQNWREHSNPPFEQLITCIHFGRLLDSKPGDEMLKQKRQALYVPKNSHS